MQRTEAVVLGPFHLPLNEIVYEFTRLLGVPQAVRDAASDAWGRRAIEHRLERGAGGLREIDYLLHGPQDGAGYLSFGLKAQPPAPKRHHNRTQQLAGLVAATQAIEEGGPVAGEVLERLAPGTSMGGARPKATLELARRRSDKPEADCVELFRRVVFNATVTNNDDHPRNHALSRGHKGWRLSPAYDLVPAPGVSLERRDLALTVVGNYGRTASIYKLLSQAGRFGLSAQEAGAQIDRVVAVVRQWRETFFACGVSAQDVDYIAPAILPECLFLP